MNYFDYEDAVDLPAAVSPLPITGFVDICFRWRTYCWGKEATMCFVILAVALVES
jgi:hypothetical protein